MELGSWGRDGNRVSLDLQASGKLMYEASSKQECIQPLCGLWQHSVQRHTMPPKATQVYPARHRSALRVLFLACLVEQGDGGRAKPMSHSLCIVAITLNVASPYSIS